MQVPLFTLVFSVMKKFIIGISLFFMTVMAIDWGYGVLSRFLITHSKGGLTKSVEYAAHECEADLLIFGSSRAMHHYVPAVLSDSLGMSCFNCGMDGNGILYLYSRYLMTINRYTPKAIVYDVSGFDLAKDDHTKYLEFQKRYCDDPGVMDVIRDINPNEPWKLKSNLYRYNGRCLAMMLLDYVHPSHNVDSTGYKPLSGVMNYEPAVSVHEKTAPEWDPMKKDYFRKLAESCREKGIKLTIAYSPQYKAKSSDYYLEVTGFCKGNGIPVIDYFATDYFNAHRELFEDRVHMNDSGAREYTNMIVKEIREIIG